VLEHGSDVHGEPVSGLSEDGLVRRLLAYRVGMSTFIAIFVSGLALDAVYFLVPSDCRSSTG
jgi:hypothetical protein